MTTFRSAHSTSEEASLNRPLPFVLPVIEDLDLDVQCRTGHASDSAGHVSGPVSGQLTDSAGGDLFDAIQIGSDRLVFLLLNIAPHSLNPPHLLAVAQQLFRVRAAELFASSEGEASAESEASAGGEGERPRLAPAPAEERAGALSQLIREMSHLLDTASSSDYSATALLGCYQRDSGELHYISTGSPHVLIKRGAAVEQVGSVGTPMGLARRASEPVEDPVHLRLITPGTASVFFTPGVVEAHSHHEEFGIHRVAAVVAAQEQTTASDLCRAVITAAIQFEQRPSRYGPPLSIPGFRSEQKTRDLTVVALLRHA